MANSALELWRWCRVELDSAWIFRIWEVLSLLPWIWLWIHLSWSYSTKRCSAFHSNRTIDSNGENIYLTHSISLNVLWLAWHIGHLNLTEVSAYRQHFDSSNFYMKPIPCLSSFSHMKALNALITESIYVAGVHRSLWN